MCCEKVPTFIDDNGFEVITLYNETGAHQRFVHELVAETFIPNPDGKKYVRHKDGNKLNNCADNLEWSDEPEI